MGFRKDVLGMYISGIIVSYLLTLIYQINMLYLFNKIQFGAGLWLLIDATVISHRSEYNTVSDKEFGFLEWLSFILITIGLILVNIPSHSQITGDGIDFDGSSKKKIQIWLIFSFIILLGGLVCGISVAGSKFLDYKPKETEKYTKQPGVFLLLSSILMCLGSIVYRFARSFESDDDDSF